LKTLELIKTRRTVHSYLSTKISEEILTSAIEAAIHAPNHKTTWPWFFIRLKPETRNRLAELQVQAKAKKASEPMSDIAKTAVRAKFLESPETLIVGIKKSADPARLKEDYASLSCAIQNLSLYLWSENIGTKWSTGGLTKMPEAYKILGLSQDTHEIDGLIFIGHAKGASPKPERPPIDDFYWDV
jgi:nitroreductase